MSCACENSKFAREVDRARRLAKALARIEGENVAIYKRPDGTFDFGKIDPARNKEIFEYITPY